MQCGKKRRVWLSHLMMSFLACQVANRQTKRKTDKQKEKTMGNGQGNEKTHVLYYRLKRVSRAAASHTHTNHSFTLVT